MTTPLTGDIKDRVEVKKLGVTLHNYPVVLDTDIAALTGIINQKAQSGKRLGAQVMVVDDLAAPTTAAIYVASGSDADSAWAPIGTVLGAAQTTAVTPA